MLSCVHRMVFGPPSTCLGVVGDGVDGVDRCSCLVGDGVMDQLCGDHHGHLGIDGVKGRRGDLNGHSDGHLVTGECARPVLSDLGDLTGGPDTAATWYSATWSYNGYLCS